MNTNVDLNQLRNEEYQQRVIVNRLRREVFAQADPTESDELFAELQEAEKDLSKIEKQLSSAEAQEPSGFGVLGEETTGLTATVQLRMAQLPTSYYHLLDSKTDPLLSCQVENSSGDIKRVRVISYIEGYSARAVNTAEMEHDSVESFDHLPTLFPESVKDLNELTRATLNLLVEDLETGKVEIHQTYPIWLLARTTAPLWVKDPQTGKWRDVTHYLGAFVTPNAPPVMEFLREAVEFHPDRQLVGYQVDKSHVEPQVRALFEALKNKTEIHYVNSVIDFSPESGSSNQRVRLPKESLKHKQANCIDGTVLFASLLEAISMSPAIVIIPGHAFVAWETWSKMPDEWRFLETTMIGSHDFDAACASAEKLAQHYQDLAENTADPSKFSMHYLRTLRVDRNITPME